jgi:hypothetical protein
MPYKKIHLADAPKLRRKRLSRFERTEEWKLMRADLEKGLKPQEACSIVLTEEDEEKYGIHNRRTIARFLQKYLARHKLPYDLKSFHRDGIDHFLILNTRKK